MSIEITLTWAEVLVAANVGVMRNVQSMKNARAGMSPDIWAANIEGAAGEMAIAKHLGIYWAGAIGDLGADDVGPYQVKTNASRKFDDMAIQKRNNPDRVYINVLSFLPRFVAVGWAWGRDAMDEKFYREGLRGMPCYFVPRSVLHPMSELPSPESLMVKAA